MINICTVSDYNYLNKGLTLYDSLLEKCDNIILHYLCIDGDTYNHLKKHENKNLKIYDINILLNSDINLLNLKNGDYKFYCWSLASYFTNFLMKNIDEPITYIDSDIYFHQSFNIILNEIGNREIAIFRHRQFDLDSNRPEGLFNVGVVYFKNGYIGKNILNWWSDAVLHKKYPNLSTCGDQKYLDNFLHMCPKDLILIDGNIGHGAPWHWQLYDFSDYFIDETIIWDDKKQILTFTHFSQFINYDDTYIPSTMHHIYTPLFMYKEIPQLKNIYDNYHNKLKKTLKKYG
jgi:hypothetical protein